MKKITSLVILALICICCTNLSEANAKGMNPKSKPMQTIHKFIGYLKSNNIEGARALLPIRERTGSAYQISFYDRESTQLENASKALQHNDIDETLWVSDVVNLDGSPYLLITGDFTKDAENTHPKSAFRFVFVMDNSDTLLAYFDYNSPKPQKSEAIVPSTIEQQINQFIGYLKHNNIKGAKEMLGLNNLRASNGSKEQNDLRSFLEDEMSTIDRARQAFQHNDIDESTWHKIDAGNDQDILISGKLKSKVDGHYSHASVTFGFRISSTDTVMNYFDYR